MEQCCDGGTVTDEAAIVASIMLDLPHLIFQSESRRRFTSTWGSLKKRSNSSSKSKFAAASLPTPRPSPPPPPSRVVGSTYEIAGPLEKALTSSPDTPLSFSASESDDKPHTLSKRKAHVNNLKKKKEQLLEIMEEFTRRNELLKKDVENKKRFHD